MAAFLDVVLSGRAVETPPMSTVNLLEGLSRTVVYMTYSQLTTLVNTSSFPWGSTARQVMGTGTGGVLCFWL